MATRRLPRVLLGAEAELAVTGVAKTPCILAGDRISQFSLAVRPVELFALIPRLRHCSLIRSELSIVPNNMTDDQ